MALLAGQEGLEPSTNGFGDRRSTIGATGLCEKTWLTGLPVDGVLAAPRAVLLQLHTIGVVLLVLISGVVAALALSAGESNQSTH